MSNCDGNSVLAFVHIHKTAGTSLNWNLRRSYGVHHADVQPWNPDADFFSANDYRRLARWAPRMDSIAGHKVRAYGDLHEAVPGVRFYTFLREPVQRLASHYQHGVQRSGLAESPEEWLQGRRNGQTIRIAGKDDLEAAIRILDQRFFFVGDVAHYDEAMVILRQRTGDPKFRIVRQSRNVARHDSHKKAMLDDPRLVDMIKENTDNDRQLYEYVKHDLFPKQRKEYGATLEADVAAYRESGAAGSVNFGLLSNLAYRRLLYRPALRVYRLVNS